MSKKLVITTVVAVIVLAVIIGYVKLAPVKFCEGEDCGKNVGQTQPQTAKQDETAGWKTYGNEQYGFKVKYPASFIGVGNLSRNSVLGSFQDPLGGIYIGYLVFVILDNEAKEKKADDYLNKYLDIAKNPIERIEGAPYITCKIVEVPNPFVDISAVYCSPAGGIYALIKGEKYSVFVDGYSGGFSDIELSRFDNPNPPEDEKLLLSTFKFID